MSISAHLTSAVLFCFAVMLIVVCVSVTGVSVAVVICCILCALVLDCHVFYGHNVLCIVLICLCLTDMKNLALVGEGC